MSNAWWQQQKYLASLNHNVINCDQDPSLHRKRLPSAILICNHGLLSQRSILKVKLYYVGNSLNSTLLHLGYSIQHIAYNRYHSHQDATWLFLRSIHTSKQVYKDESKVEKTVKALKEQTPAAEKDKFHAFKPTTPVTPSVKKEVDKPVKKSIGQVSLEVKHTEMVMHTQVLLEFKEVCWWGHIHDYHTANM